MPDESGSKNNSTNSKSKKLTAMAPVPIQMIDHESDDLEIDSGSGSGKAWCKNIMIGEYTVITGSNNVKFVVWTITIETLKNSKIVIRKRYSDFVVLREYLLKQYPTNAIEIPRLPAKSVLLNFESGFLEKRRNGLEFFISSVLLNPRFCTDEVVKQFVME